jgi:hypothetical protein
MTILSAENQNRLTAPELDALHMLGRLGMMGVGPATNLYDGKLHIALVAMLDKQGLVTVKPGKDAATGQPVAIVRITEAGRAAVRGRRAGN